jgi:transcriptional regulator with XRE-family HTH domain
MSFDDQHHSPSDAASPRAQQRTTADWEARIGEQLRRARLAEGLDQADLAAQSDVSIGALRSLERGTGSTVKTLVRVARALGREAWLGSLAPAVTVSPIEVLRNGRAERTRVYRSRAASASRPGPDARGHGRD